MVRNFDRPDQRLIRQLGKFQVATLHESLGKETDCVMTHEIRPIQQSMRLIGPALTVDCSPADNLTLHLAMTLAKKGDVLLVNGHGSQGVMFGGVMCLQCKILGVKGIVIDGAVRDVSEISSMNFPCFARFISPKGSSKAVFGSINTPIQCGGVLVRPGDIICGDSDGIVVIPQERAASVLKTSTQKKLTEDYNRRLIRKGSTTYEIMHLGEKLKASNVREFDHVKDLDSQSS